MSAKLTKPGAAVKAVHRNILAVFLVTFGGFMLSLFMTVRAALMRPPGNLRFAAAVTGFFLLLALFNGLNLRKARRLQQGTVPVAK